MDDEFELEKSLLNCAFCLPSEDVQLVRGLAPHNEKWCWVQCGCGARGPMKETYREAAYAWNTRCK